jgi:hypothetical protein
LEPAQQGIRLGDAGNLLEHFAAQSFGDLSQGASLLIRESKAIGQLCPENSVFGQQVLIAQ